jgi:hypothetical protein
MSKVQLPTQGPLLLSLKLHSHDGASLSPRQPSRLLRDLFKVRAPVSRKGSRALRNVVSSSPILAGTLSDVQIDVRSSRNDLWNLV